MSPPVYSMPKESWDKIEIEIEQIGNGFIVRGSRHESRVGIWGEQTYLATLDEVKDHLRAIFDSATLLNRDTGREDF